MSEEFLDFDEIENNNTSSNRPFILAVGALLLTLFACIGATALWSANQQPGENTELAAEIAQIEATNVAIATQNAFVTQTIVAREELAQATSTPTAIPPTPTATATKIPEPTATIIVSEVGGAGATAASGDDSDSENGEAATTDNESGEAGENAGTDDNTSDSGNDNSSESGDNGNGSSSTDASSNQNQFSTPTPSASGVTTLPQTGISIFGIISLALSFLGVLLISRFIRNSL